MTNPTPTLRPLGGWVGQARKCFGGLCGALWKVAIILTLLIPGPGLSASDEPLVKVQALRTEMARLEESQPRVALEKGAEALQVLSLHPAPSLELEVVTHMARLQIHVGDLASADKLLTRGEALAPALKGDPRTLRLAATRASLTFFEGRPAEAKAKAMAVREEALQAGDFPAAIEALEVLGQCEGGEGNFLVGIEWLQEAIDLCDRGGSPSRRQGLLSVLSNFYIDTKHWPKALKANQEAMAIARTLNLPNRLAGLHLNASLIQAKLGNHEAEVTHLREAEAMGRALGNEGILLNADLGMVDVLIREKDYSQALARSEMAIERAQRLGDTLQLEVAKFDRGMALNRLGQHRAGLAAMEAAHAGLSGASQTEEVEFLGALAEEYAHAGDYRKAFDRLRSHREASERLFSEERTRTAAELEARFQSERQAREIDLLKAQAQRRTLIRNFSILGVLLSLALVAAVLSRLRESRRNQALLEARVQERTKALEQSQETILRTQRLNLVATLGAGLAHDLNNLLTVVCTLAEQGGAKEDLVQTARRAAALARKSMAHAEDAGGSRELFDLAEVIRTLRPVLQRLAGRGIEVHLETDGNEAWMEADPLQVEQLLVNLVTNARDAMKGEGHLWISLDIAASHATLRVRDDGPGMDPETLSRIFDPFFTTKAPGKGTGLGLPSIKAFLDAHGGSIAVDSRLGDGTCFTLTLPHLAGL